MHRRGLLLGIVLGELLIVLLLGTSAWFQFAREEQRVIRQSLSGWAVVAEEAGLHFASADQARTLAAVRRFRDQAVTMRAAWLNETGETWQVYLESLLDQQKPSEIAYGALKKGSREVIREDGQLYVPVPFATADGSVRGLLWIEHDRSKIARATLLDPAWLSFQLMFFVILSAQLVLTCIVIARRHRTIVFEKGYLKDHAVGALKLQHRLLGQIIRDHESEVEERAPAAAVEVREPGKVIPFDRALRRSPDDEGKS